MMIAELVAKWAARRDEWRRLTVQVSGAVIAQEVVDDLSGLLTETDETVTLQAAHQLGGYSVDHLQRLVASGKLTNVGRKGRPRVRRSEVPVRPGWKGLRESGDDAVLAERRRIVASVVTGGGS